MGNNIVVITYKNNYILREGKIIVIYKNNKIITAAKNVMLHIIINNEKYLIKNTE